MKEQGCAVLAARDAGKIVPSRHESYVRLYELARENKPLGEKLNFRVRTTRPLSA